VESLGNVLRSARESRKLDYETAGRDTKISSRYLEALEDENFSVFPGETYLIGFLDSYGAYLGLDVNDLKTLYRAARIQEQPIPVAQLIPSRRPAIPRAFIWVLPVLVGGLLAGAGFLIYSRLSRPAANPSQGRRAVEHPLGSASLEERFYLGDSVLVPLGQAQYKLELSALGETVTLSSPGGQVILDMSQELTLDIDGNGTADIRIGVLDYTRNNRDAGALLRLDIYQDTQIAAEPQANSAASPLVPDAAPTISAAAPVIFTSPNPYPFTMQIRFQGYCLFRWEILAEPSRPERNERYFQRTDELSIQAQNGVRLGISNAASLNVEVIGGGRTVPLDLGSAGETVAADLRWVRDNDGRYRLILSRLN
jgi:hypothetical protein